MSEAIYLSNDQVSVCRAVIDAATVRYEETVNRAPYTAFASLSTGSVLSADDEGWLTGPTINTIAGVNAYTRDFLDIGFTESEMMNGIWVVRNETRKPSGEIGLRDKDKVPISPERHKFASYDVNTGWKVMQLCNVDAADWQSKWASGELETDERTAIARIAADASLAAMVASAYDEVEVNHLERHVSAVAFTEHGDEALVAVRHMMNPMNGENRDWIWQHLRTVFSEFTLTTKVVRRLFEGTAGSLDSTGLQMLGHALGRTTPLTKEVLAKGGPSIPSFTWLYPPFEKLAER